MSTKKVAIQGQNGSYHDLARQTYFADSELLARDTFKQVFETLEAGACEYGLVAIENSLYGSINEVYDLLLKHQPWICGEIYQRIHHCLLGVGDVELSDVEEVHSQREALGQCEYFLENKLPQAERFATQDTAQAAAEVKAWNDPTKVAIASEAAAKLHGLKILQREIETNKQNYTRFIVICPEKTEPEDGDSKTSIVLKLADKPGALYEALGAFAKRNINLTKLESRPIIGQAWQYMFYLDYEVPLESPQSRATLKELSDQGGVVTVLGSFQEGELVK